VPEAVTAQPGLWVHTDPAGQDQAARAGQARALSGDWQSGTEAERVRALTGWCVLKAYLMARLDGSVTLSEGDTELLTIDPTPRSSSGERLRAARVLYGTADILAQGTRQLVPYQTTAPPVVGRGETGALPAIAIVAIVAVSAVAVAYVAHEAAVVIDRNLARNADTARLVQADAAAQELVEAHVAREDEAGAPLPLDAATKTRLDALARLQGDIAKKQLSPMRSALPHWPLPERGDWLTLAALLAAGVGLYVFTRTRST
jgi:hypothetical protein